MTDRIVSPISGQGRKPTLAHVQELAGELRAIVANLGLPMLVYLMEVVIIELEDTIARQRAASADADAELGRANYLLLDVTRVDESLVTFRLAAGLGEGSGRVDSEAGPEAGALGAAYLDEID